MPEEYTELDLWDAIIEDVVSYITCGQCGLEQSLRMPDDSAAAIWFNAGWRGNEDGAYCPKCSKYNKLK